MSQIKKIVFGTMAVLLVLCVFRKTFLEWYNAGHKKQAELQPKDTGEKDAHEGEDITADKLTLEKLKDSVGIEAYEKEDITLDTLSLKNEMRIFEDNNLPHERKMEKVDDLRRRRLEEECSRLGYNDAIWNSKDLKKHPHLSILVSENQQMMFCYTGDAHSKMWKKILGDSRSIYSYGESSATYRVKFYHNLLLVQQPLVRLLAAYKSWLAPVQEGQGPYGDTKLYEEMKRISDKIQSEGYRNLNSTKDSSFSAFVSFIVKQVQSKETLHPLWERISVLCQPCALNYDYISRTETGLDDFKQNLSNFRKLPPEKYVTIYNASSGAKMLEEIRKSLPSELLEQVYEAYKTDHELFGYPKP